MMDRKAQPKPKCCGEVVWTSISPRIEYWYCRGCKKELSETTPSVNPWKAEEDKNFAAELEEFEKFLAGSIGPQKDDDDQLVTLRNGSTVKFKIEKDPDDLTGTEIQEDVLKALIKAEYKKIFGGNNAGPIPVARTRQDVERIAAEAREYADRLSPDDIF